MLNLGDSEQASAELWRSLPPLDGFARFQDVRPGAAVLLRHPTERTGSGEPLPIVAVREFGKGKVMLVGTDSTWRWKLAGGKDWKLSSFYARFWNRAVQYLTGSLELKKVKFGPLPDRMPAREPAVLSLRVFDEHFRPLSGTELDLKFRPLPGEQRPCPPSRRSPASSAELAGLAEGRHCVRRGQAPGRLWRDETAFLGGAQGGRPDRKRLRAYQRAGATRISIASTRGMAQGPGPARESGARRRTPWPRRAWLWALVALLCVEWFLRRRMGYL